MASFSGRAPDSPAQLLDLYAPGPLFSWPELQSMAADGVLAQLYQHGYTVPGMAASPQLRARAAAFAVTDQFFIPPRAKNSSSQQM